MLLWSFLNWIIILFGKTIGGFNLHSTWHKLLVLNIVLYDFFYSICSDFANIFDVDWFISFLAKDIPVVKQVPDKYMRSLEKPPYTTRVPRKSEPQYYLDEVLPILWRRHVRRLCYFTWILKCFDIPSFIQKGRPFYLFEVNKTT